jgi:hypothetical protein
MNAIGISLGCSCDSAVWGVQQSIRKTKENEYKTCPFDEMLSNFPGLIECLKDDFKYFCDINYLTMIETPAGPFIYNTKYKFAFNHESPGHDNIYLTQKWPEGINHFINNNFANFINRYTKRIQSFRNYLSNPNNYISFILQRYNTRQVDLTELREVFQLHYPDLNYYINLLFIDNNRAGNILRTLKFDDNDPEVTRLKYWYE